MTTQKTAPGPGSKPATFLEEQTLLSLWHEQQNLLAVKCEPLVFLKKRKAQEEINWTKQKVFGANRPLHLRDRTGLSVQTAYFTSFHLILFSIMETIIHLWSQVAPVHDRKRKTKVFDVWVWAKGGRHHQELKNQMFTFFQEKKNEWKKKTRPLLKKVMKGSWEGLGHSCQTCPPCFHTSNPHLLGPFTPRQVSLKTVKFVWLSVKRVLACWPLILTKSSLKLINSINLAHLNRSAPTYGCLFTAPSRRKATTKGRRRRRVR